MNEHIYHTLEPQNEHSAVVDGTVYDSLCKLDVMLPNGQMVPATLVRNVHGRVIPLVGKSKYHFKISPPYDAKAHKE